MDFKSSSKLSISILFKLLFHSTSASSLTVSKSKLSFESAILIMAFSILTDDSPTFTWSSLLVPASKKSCAKVFSPTTSVFSIISPSPTKFDFVIGFENFATKKTFWFFAQPVLFLYPEIVLSSTILIWEAVVLSQFMANPKSIIIDCISSFV